MTTGHFQVRAGMEVLGADQRVVGQISAVRDSDFVVERPTEGSIAIPFGAIGEVTANQVVLTITADHVDTIKWPQQPDPVDQQAETSTAADTIVL